jgi:hypothetical protein
MRRPVLAACFTSALLGLAVPALGTDIGAKLKSNKVQGDLIPAYACVPDDPSVDCSGSLQVRSCSDGTGPCGSSADCTAGGTCTVGAVTKSSAYGRTCTFEKGTFKVQSGKATNVQLVKVSCTGAPLPTELCAHVVQFTTIVDRNIDSKGNATPTICNNPVAGDVAGTSSFAVAQRGTLTCSTKGTCKGVLPQSIIDPCPTVDKVYQVVRIDVFDGPVFASVNVGGGTTLQACCGRNQTVIANVLTSDQPDCQGTTQDVLATSGTVLQVK